MPRRPVHDPLADTNTPPSFERSPVNIDSDRITPPAVLVASYRACSEPLPDGGECLRRSGHKGDHRPSLRRSVAADLRFQGVAA